ncbi:MAG TPA: prepilin-type N-terminal cleavage/methylation domain-containing protein [Longimicrobium sp.]|jgi:prepilin-type N-terminal cleavage/methylation domain-containing protein
MKAPPTRDPRAGFTLIEVMMVAMIIVALTSVALASNRENPHRLVYHEAQQIRADVTEAVSTSEARGGDALLVANATVRSRVGGSFLATADTMGMREADVLDRERTSLNAGVQWGAGSAVAGPLGEATNGGPVPRLVRCSAGRGCNVGVGGSVTYYLTHARDASAVAAVVLTPDGIAHLYRYIPNGAAWSTEAPR